MALFVVFLSVSTFVACEQRGESQDTVHHKEERIQVDERESAGGQGVEKLVGSLFSPSIQFRELARKDFRGALKEYMVESPTAHTPEALTKLPDVWKHFMAFTTIRYAHLRSEDPVVMYFNPVYDGALVTQWSTGEKAPRITQIAIVDGRQLYKGRVTRKHPVWERSGKLPENIIAAHREFVSMAEIHLAPFGKEKVHVAGATRKERVDGLLVSAAKISHSIGQYLNEEEFTEHRKTVRLLVNLMKGKDEDGVLDPQVLEKVGRGGDKGVFANLKLAYVVFTESDRMSVLLVDPNTPEIFVYAELSDRGELLGGSSYVFEDQSAKWTSRWNDLLGQDDHK